MKTIRLFMLAAVAMLFVNCAHEELDAPLKTGVAVALMETEDTKSNATDEGYFTWATGDKIWINTSSGNLTGTLSDGAGTPNGTFTYSYVDGQIPTGYAMYPYSASHNIADDKITFNMPAAYELGTTITNTNAAMLAVPTNRTTEETATFNFSHLGGVFRFVIKNAPVGADKFTLSLGGKKINGDFAVASNDDGAYQITTADAAEGDNLTTLSFTALSTAQDITLFVPVPVGEYTGIAAKLYDGETELGSWGSETATNEVTRRALVLMSPITFSTTGGNIENEQQVATQTQLTEAIAKGGSITVTEGITLTEAITIPAAKEVTLDLNGNNITASQVITVGEGATLSIVNNGQAVAVKSGEATSSASITSDDDIIKASKNSTITIGEGVALHSNKNCAIFVPAAASGVTINTAGNLSAAANYASLYVNGNVTSGTINITGGSIKHDSGVAAYIAGNVDVNVSGGVITGTTAMEVRAGKVTVNGGEFIATADPSTYQPNGNGTTSTGIALAMCKHSTTEFTLTAVVNGGTFTGAKSILVNTDLGEVSCTVNGGTFSAPTPLYYLGDNADVDVTLNADYTGAGFKAKPGQKIDLNLGGKIYTASAPLVGSTGTETLGFQFLSGSAVNISKGTITSSVAKMLINNYTDLTLEDVTLSPTVPSLDLMKSATTGNIQTYYVLSNNSGNVNLKGNTNIVAPTLEGLTSYAFDVCKYSTYSEPIVNWNSTGKVTGSIELSGGTFKLGNDLELTGSIDVISTAKVELGDNDIKSTGSDVFNVNGGDLTITGTDEAKVTAPSSQGTVSAVWAHNGGTVTIDGGYYSVGADKDGYRNDLIYAGSNSPVTVGTITINGGKFEYTGTSSEENEKDGDLFLLNCADSSTDSRITVNGGSFKNHVPGSEQTGTNEVVLGTDKKVYNGETEVTTAHSGSTDVWYTVM